VTCAPPRSSAPAFVRPFLRRLGLAALLAIVVATTIATAAAHADPAPQQWLPTSPDLVRNLRPCRMAVSAPTPPVCWSVAEDAAAWMAQPAGSPYPWGQCTYYAGLLRPDIWNNRAPPSADPLSDNWDAWTWVEHAQAEGLPVDGDPQPGDVMVYSQAAVGNQTGHVAIVDAVGAPSASSPDVELTISEMNVDDLDDASLGQGDTIALLVPRSELVPGMIQFIHRPARGYVVPAWPVGSDDGYVAAVATTPPASGDPSLAIGVSGDALETVSESTSPMLATVMALPGGTVVKQMSITANQIVALGLPGGSYRVCVSQPPDGVWPAVSACATGAWKVPPSSVSVRVGRGRAGGGGRQLTLPVVLNLSRGAQVSRVAAVVRVVERRLARVGRRWVVRTITLGRTSLHLRSGSQVVRLALATRELSQGHTVLRLSIPAQTSSGYRVEAAQISWTVR
jgi:surface antigen